MTIDNYPFIQCLYCDARISCKYPYLYYHAYKKHPEKIREVFENGFEFRLIPGFRFRLKPLDIPKLMSKERAYKIFLKTLEEINQRKRELR